MFEIEDLFELSLDGAFQSLEEFKDFANSADDETLFSVITPGAFKDLEEFKLSLVEKKNPIVTPSDGEEVLTESTTETEVQDGVSDSLEVNEVVEEGVINESQLNFGDQTGPNSIDTEVDVVEEEDSFGEYIGKGLDVGVSTVSKSIYDLPSLIYDAAATLTNPIARALGIEEASSEKFAKTFNLKNIPSEIVGKRIAEKQKEIQEYNDANGGDALAAIEDGNILGAAKMIAGTTAQSIPLMIPAFFSGGSSVGLGIVGASTASTKAATLKEDNPDMDVSSRTINAVTTGILEATLGQLLTGASGNAAKKILSTEGSKKGAKIISDSFKEMLESSIEKSPILPLFGEMLEEALVSVGEQLTDISTGVKTDFSMREVINSGISAVGMGGANTVSVYGSKAYVSSKEYRKLKQVNKKLSKLSDEVSSNLDLSDDEKTILNKSIDRLKAKANGIVDKANDKVSLLPNDVKQELDNTLLNLDEISVAAFRINSNKDTPIEIKEVLLNELKAQAIELTDKKNKILSAEYILNEFEKLPDNEKASLKEQATEILLKEAKDAGQTEINITENQIADKANELLKQNQDAIQEPSTEKQVLPNEETSGVDGSIPEVGLQQVGEGNVEQDTTGKKIEEGDTQTDQVVDTTTETDAEQLDVSFDLSDLERNIKNSDKEGTLLDNLEKKGYSNGKEGMIRVDKENKNTLVFETNDEIIELGRKDEVGNNTLASADITLMPPEGVNLAPIGTTKGGKSLDVFTVDGVDYTITGRRRDKKGKAVVRVKEVKSGLNRRLVGEKAERILKDEALRNRKTPQEIKLTVEGKEVIKPVTKKQSRKEAKEEYDKKTLSEIEAMEKKSEEDFAEFEEMVLEEAASNSNNQDIIQLGDNIFQVTKKKDGSFTVSQMRDDGKLIPVKNESTRKKPIGVFKSKKSNEERRAIIEAEKLINDFKSEEQDKVLNFLDKAISATSNKGRAFDATLGIPMFAANSSLKIIKASYKAGKNIVESIQDALDSLRKQGYNPNQYNYKKYVLNELKPKTTTQPTSTEEVMSVNEEKSITPNAAIKKAGKVLGLKIPPPAGSEKFTSTVKKEIKVFWNNWNKAFRESKYDQDTKRKDLNEIINSLEKSGNLSKAKSKSLRNKVAKVNLNNTKVVSDVIDYARKSMNDADYTNKLNKSKKLRSLIKKNAKTKEAGLSDSAKNFSEIDPSKVEDIDTYLEKAQEIKDGLIPTKEVKSGLKTSTPFDTKKADEYTQKEKESQKEKAYELQKESFEDLTGLDSKDLTLEEMRDLLIALDGDTLTEEGKSKAVNEKKDAVEKALKQAISNAKINVKQVIADSDVEISKQDKKLLSEFLKMDMNVLTTEQKMKALDAILIFETNQSTGGMKSILKQAEGKKGMISLAKQKIITSAKSWMVGRYWNKSISTLPNVFELMFGSPKKGAIAMKNMGVTEAVNGAAKAERQSEDILTDYGNSFNKKKMKSGIYFDESNDIERGILGEIQRFTPGQEVKDFTDSKNLIEETYENLLKSTNKENIAKGEIIKEAYDRLVKDSNNISEVQSKADPANLEGVKYLTDVWASNYESLAEVSLNVYNKNLGKDTNYIPRSIQNISVEKSPDRDITQPLFNPDGTSSVYSKKTGVLEEATKPGKFENSNKILNLGFDSQNMANLKAALTDVNTAAAIQQIKGAITSDAFEQVFPNDQSRQIVKDRIIKYIDAKRAGEKINEDDKKLLKILNKGATFGVVKALGGLTQPFKQLVPIFNTAINAGPINTTKASALIFNKDVQDAINNSGLGIANRGASSQGDISGVDSRIKQAAKTKGGKIVDAIDKLNKDVIDVFLVKTDVQTARASFIAYYLKAMDKKGVKSGDIDFTKPLDKEASQYAQQQVDRQQNTSDSDLQGDLFTGKGLGVQVLRKTLFPFANFLLNQKTRMYSDINTLTRKRKTALPGDKTAAAKSLAGLATETAIFNAIGLGITQMLSNVARMYTGEEEEGAEEKKQKEFDSRLAGRIGNVVADVLVPIPALNSLALSQANSLLSIMQEGDDNPFKFFAKTDKDLIDQLGVFGIGIKKATILKDMIMTIQSGEITSENFGKKSSKKLTPEAIDNLKGVASAYALHLVGMLPFSEVGYLSERAYKNISKMKLDESPMILSAPKKKKTMKKKSTSFSKPTSFGSGKKKKSFSPKSFGN